VSQSFVESHPTAIMQDQLAGDQGEWDICIQANPDDPPAGGTTYYFRFYNYTDATELEFYDVYPQLTTYTPPTWGAYGTVIRFDPANYTPSPTAIYFEAVIAAGASGQTVYARLYNITEDTPVSGSEVSSTVVYPDFERVRSGNLTLPTYPVELRAEIGSKPGETNYIKGARLIIYQSA